MENKKKEKTKIDIILPNFNSFEFISETVKSVLNQSYKNWKLIIVDDFSDKKTRSLLKKISRIIHVVVNQRIVVATLLEKDLDGE